MNTIAIDRAARLNKAAVEVQEFVEKWMNEISVHRFGRAQFYVNEISPREWQEFFAKITQVLEKNEP